MTYQTKLTTAKLSTVISFAAPLNATPLDILPVADEHTWKSRIGADLEMT